MPDYKKYAENKAAGSASVSVTDLGVVVLSERIFCPQTGQAKFMATNIGLDFCETLRAKAAAELESLELILADAAAAKAQWDIENPPPEPEEEEPS